MQHSGRGATPDASEARPGRHTRRDDQKAAAGPKASSGAFAAEVQALRTDLEERTRDLQRLTAEYANYRRRVERDRALVAEQATGAVLAELLGVLDDIDRARDHGDLVGPFGAVADQLVSVLTKLGLTPFGDAGDPFDPSRHEAVAHSLSTEVSEPTCVQVFRRGYGFGERLLRPALVAVADPSDEEPDTDQPAPAEAEASAAEAATSAAGPAAAGAADAGAAEAGGTDAEAAEGEQKSADESEVETVETDPVEAEVIDGEVVDPEAAAVAESASGEADADEPYPAGAEAAAPEPAAEPEAEARAGSEAEARPEQPDEAGRGPNGSSDKGPQS